MLLRPEVSPWLNDWDLFLKTLLSEKPLNEKPIPYILMAKMTMPSIPMHSGRLSKVFLRLGSCAGDSNARLASPSPSPWEARVAPLLPAKVCRRGTFRSHAVAS